MANPFVHIELDTTDLSKAKTFYTKLFDWKLEDVPMEMGSYTMINVGEGTGGGMMKQPVPGAPSAWLAYVQVDDIAAATKKAKSLGATIMKDVTEVMGRGLVEHYYRSNRRDARTLEAEESLIFEQLTFTSENGYPVHRNGLSFNSRCNWIAQLVREPG